MLISAPSKRVVLCMLALSVLALPLAAGAASKILMSGAFEGRSNHVVTGKVAIVQTDEGMEVRLEDDFSLDGAPDPKLGFGKNGYVPGTLFSVLRKHTGRQTYRLPPTIDPSKYNEVYVWCEQFNVPLGVAKLQ